MRNKLLLLFFSVLCLQIKVADANDKITITGSSTVAPLVLEIAKRYEKNHTGTRIDVQTGGSSRGINDTRSGLADIGMVSRAIKADETDLLGYTIAMDGIGIILHRDNPVTALTNEEIIAIYTGKITNWQELGGQNKRITVVNKAEGRSTLELFLQYFALKNSQIKAQVIIGDNQQGIKTVAGNPGAIAYVSIGTAEYETQLGTPIKLLPMAGVAATVDNVKNGKFPLSRQLNLVVINQPTGLIKEFIEYTQSKEVHDLIKAQFFVPVQN